MSLMHSPTLAGMPSTEDWRVKHHFNFIYEVPTATVEPLLPSRIVPREARPGICLLNVGWMRLHPGQHGGLPEFDELTLSLHVQPDLSLDAPIPRMSLYDIRIGSNSEQFLAYEAEHQMLNGFYSPTLRCELSEDETELRASDEHGPLFVMRNTHPKPHYKQEVAVGQYYSVFGGQLYQGVFLWEGNGCEHQREGDSGRLYLHPFFEGIDVEEIEDCYMQMLLEPGSEVMFRSFSPREYR